MARKNKEEIDDVLAELDDIDEDVFDEDEADDPTDEDRKSRKKGSKKSRTKKAASKKSKPAREGVGTAELAEAAGIESRVLRQLLRREFPMAEGETRYVWKSLDDPQAKKILKRIAAGGASDAVKERLSELKNRKGKKASSKKSATKKSGAKRKR